MVYVSAPGQFEAAAKRVEISIIIIIVDEFSDFDATDTRE